MINSFTAPYAALILRLSLGILFLAHVALKIFVFTIPGFVGYFGSLGLPPDSGIRRHCARIAGWHCADSGYLRFVDRCAAGARNAGLDLSRAWGQRLAVHQQGRRLGISGVLGCLPRRLVSAR
jgi:hypothetical protein